MKVPGTSEIQPQEKGGGLFMRRVTVQPALDSEGNALRTNPINFDEGAVNVFHVRDVDQVLYVTAGEGIIATESEEITIRPGDFVIIRPARSTKLSSRARRGTYGCRCHSLSLRSGWQDF